jgi:hypothetical protein
MKDKLIKIANELIDLANSLEKPKNTEPNRCGHSNKKTMHGKGEFGNWTGEKCNDCGAVRFYNEKKSSWKDWQVGR